jgi:hypothetical protein
MNKISNSEIKIEYCTKQAEIYLEYCLMYPNTTTSEISKVCNIEASYIYSKCHSESQVFKNFKELNKTKIL